MTNQPQDRQAGLAQSRQELDASRSEYYAALGAGDQAAIKETFGRYFTAAEATFDLATEPEAGS